MYSSKRHVVAPCGGACAKVDVCVCVCVKEETLYLGSIINITEETDACATVDNVCVFYA